MYADLDQLVLSGRLFNASPYSSPARTPSPDHDTGRAWPLDGVGEGGDDDYASDSEREKRIAKIMDTAPQDAPPGGGSIGMGPGRTGVKGVIRDRAEAQARVREKRASEMVALNARMERANLGGKTFLEEEHERELERMMLEGLVPGGGMSAGQRGSLGKEKPRFGHLREVGVKNFVSAVEKEDKGVWVIIHLYDSSLDRCHDLDTELSRLARSNPDAKFLRARASALGFASSSSSMPRALSSGTAPRSNLRTSRNIITEEDEDDPYADGEKDLTDMDGDENEGEYNSDEEDVDLDVLPTLLAYRDGELVHTWVRVDWEAGRAGVEDLLFKHHLLKGSGAGFGNCGLPSDDEELWDSE